MNKANVNDVEKCGRFAVVLKCLLMKYKMTQSELAVKTGLSEATITHYVKGKTTPSQTNVNKIANAIGVSPRSFYEDIEEFSPYIDNKESIFAQTLKELISEKNISQEQLAKEIGVSRQTVNQYINGKQFPNKEVLTKISEYFDVSIETIIGKQITQKKSSPMRIVVSQMPTDITECYFSRCQITNGCYECMLGGLCDLDSGICSKLVEVGM